VKASNELERMGEEVIVA